MRTATHCRQLDLPPDRGITQRTGHDAGVVNAAARHAGIAKAGSRHLDDPVIPLAPADSLVIEAEIIEHLTDPGSHLTVDTLQIAFAIEILNPNLFLLCQPVLGKRCPVGTFAGAV